MVAVEYIPGLGLIGALPVEGIEETEAFHYLISDNDFDVRDVNSTSHYVPPPSIPSKFDASSLTSSWLVFFDGLGNDRGHSIDVRSDGKSVITGETDSDGSGDFDIILSQLDNEGNLLWKNIIGSTGYDKGRFVRVTSDEGVIAIGTISVLGAGDKDCVVIRADNSGVITWAYAFGTAETEEGNFVDELLSGEFIFTGYTGQVGVGSSNNFFLIKISSGGTFLRGKVFDGTERDHARCKATLDGGVICISSTRSFTNGWYDLALVRLDSDWNVLWQELFTGSVDDYGFVVEEVSDGDFVSAGFTGSFGVGGLDGLLLKVASDGFLMWAVALGASDHESIYFMKKISDGNFVVVGWTESFGADGKKVFFAKVRDAADHTNMLMWAKVLRGVNDGEGWAVEETDDGKVVLTGFADRGSGDDDIFVAKVYADGTADDCSIIEDVTHLMTVTDIKGLIGKQNAAFSINDFNPMVSGNIKDSVSVKDISLTREVTCQYITPTPRLTPTAPFLTPTAPVVTPSARYETPTAPVVTPSARYETPTAPVVTPSARYETPTPPVVTPSARYETPTAPVVTPSARHETPTAPVVTPSARYETPTAPVVTPSARYETPTAPVVTPSARHETPTAPVVTPSARYETPTAPVVTPSAVHATLTPRAMTSSVKYATPTPRVVTPSARYETPTAPVVTPSAVHATLTPRAMTSSVKYATPTPRVVTPSAVHATLTPRAMTLSAVHATLTPRAMTLSARYETPTRHLVIPVVSYITLAPLAVTILPPKLIKAELTPTVVDDESGSGFPWYIPVAVAASLLYLSCMALAGICWYKRKLRTRAAMENYLMVNVHEVFEGQDVREMLRAISTDESIKS